MNASRSFTLTLSVMAAALIAALPVPAAAQPTAAPTIQNSPTACPQGTVAQPQVSRSGAVACKTAIDTQGTGVVGKHAINTKGTGNNRTSSPAPGTTGVRPPPDLDVDSNGQVVSPRDAASGLATGRTQLPVAPSRAASKTGHVTLNR